jgi:hypothetical protein
LHANPELGAYLGAIGALYMLWGNATQQFGETVERDHDAALVSYIDLIDQIYTAAQRQYVPESCQGVQIALLDALGQTRDSWLAYATAPDMEQFAAAMRELSEQLAIVTTELARLRAKYVADGT